MSETGDTPLLSGVGSHVDTSGEPQTGMESGGDTASPPGAPIQKRHYVVETSPLPPTAGELREGGYDVPDDVPDDVVPAEFASDSPPVAPAQEVGEETGDASEASSATEEEVSAEVDASVPTDEPASEEVSERSKEFREGLQAALDDLDDPDRERSTNPYDGRTRQGREWVAGYAEGSEK